MAKLKVKSGLDNLIESNFKILHGQRVGILANQASVDSNFRHILDLLANNNNFTLVKIFAPEHGFTGALQDMAEVKDTRHPIYNLPIVSLYGASEKSLAPKKEDLQDIDILLCDLPDIGTRYYTFAQSIGYSMMVAKEANTRVIIIDRPNPLGGESIEGAPLLKNCRSFCGYAPIPNRHGMTIGELALLMNHGFGTGDDAISAINCELEILKLSGWKRSMYFDETELPWVLPSPNMPSLNTAIVYPGQCLFEATNASEGRGTTLPFEMIGAPYIDPVQLGNWQNLVFNQGIELQGALLRQHSFLPKFQKHTDAVCYGFQLHILDRLKFKPTRWGLALIRALAESAEKDFAWRSTTYEFRDDIPAIDLLYGSANFRKCVESKESLEGINSEMTKFETEFAELRKEFLLY